MTRSSSTVQSAIRLGHVARTGGLLTVTVVNVKRLFMAKSHAKLFLKEVFSGHLREAELQEGIQARHLADVGYQELCYFEMTPAQALKLRQDDRP